MRHAIKFFLANIILAIAEKPIAWALTIWENEARRTKGLPPAPPTVLKTAEEWDRLENTEDIPPAALDQEKKH